MTTLLLAGPYGSDATQAWGIRLRATDTFDPTRLRKVLLTYSCHPPAIRKIRRLLETIGQYHCYLQYTWFSNAKSRESCIHELREIGVELDVTEQYMCWRGDCVGRIRPFDSPPGEQFVRPLFD